MKYTREEFEKLMFELSLCHSDIRNNPNKETANNIFRDKIEEIYSYFQSYGDHREREVLEEMLYDTELVERYADMLTESDYKHFQARNSQVKEKLTSLEK